MKCEQYVNLMSGYLDGDLSDQDKESWKQHFSDCSACNSFFKSFQSSLELLEYLKDQPCPANVAARLEALITQKAQERQKP